MKPIDPQRAESVFGEALARPPGEQRVAFLRKACHGQPELEAWVDSLLRAHESAGSFLTTTPAPPSEPLPAPPPMPADDRIPALAGFRILRRVAAGGLGTVYAGHDEKLNRPVAIKVLHRPADAAVRARVLEEARQTAAVNDPAIVTVFSVLDDTDPPAIVMEWVEGFPIDRVAERLSPIHQAQLLREVIRGLTVAHRHGLIHRDLKPANVIVGPDLRPRILDFGLALTLDEAARQGRGFEGTPLYASPEQVLGQPLTPASDVFSFGSLMFAVLAGRPPFAGSSLHEVLDALTRCEPPLPREVAVGIPEDLQAICLACLARNPTDRPTALEVAQDLGRFLAGEPVRLRPKLYGDQLRRRISEQARDLVHWESQGIVTREERDQLTAIHRRLLADEDHWIIDARRLTVSQTVLYAGTWLVVVASVLLAWLAHDELSPLWRWLAPLLGTGSLLALGLTAERRREPQASASFLAAATLSLVPTTMSLLQQAGFLSTAPGGVRQLFGDAFTNAQFMVSCAGAFILSTWGLARLRLTGFAWTTAALGVATYLAFLMTRNWLDWPLHEQAVACLPLIAAEPVALWFESRGRVRWSAPFQWIALLALVGGLDAIAYDGPTLALLGFVESPDGYWDHSRLQAASFAMNGVLFLALALTAERAASLDLRRTSRTLEFLAMAHTLGPLFGNALEHREDSRVWADVSLYLAFAMAYLILGPWRLRWRMLVGALAGVAFGSYLLVDLNLVPRRWFVLVLGTSGLLCSAAVFIRRLRGPRPDKPQTPLPSAHRATPP